MGSEGVLRFPVAYWGERVGQNRDKSDTCDTVVGGRRKKKIS